MRAVVYVGVVGTLGLLSLGASAAGAPSSGQAAADVTVRRLEGNPIVGPNLGRRIGTNVQGPSLIRVPEWLPNPLGKYYLYFADHKGTYIRLAYADELAGPWKIYDPGTLQIEQSHFRTEPVPVPDQVQEQVALGGWAPRHVEGVPERLESATKPHIARPAVTPLSGRHRICTLHSTINRT